MPKKILVLIFLLNFSFALAQSTNNPEEDFAHISKLYQNGLYDVTAELFRDFVKNYPQTPKSSEAQFLAGMSYFNVKDYENSRKEFLKAINNFPDSPRGAESWKMLASCLTLMNRLDEAAKSLEKIAVFYPKNQLAPETLLEAARLYEKLKDFKKAENLLDQLANEYKNSDFYIPSRMQKVSVYRNSQNFPKAYREISVLEKIVKGNELLAAVAYQKAKTQEAEDKSCTAEETFSFAVKKYPQTRFGKISQVELGKLQRKNGNHQQAKKTFTELTKDKDAEVVFDAKLELAKTLVLLGEFSQAVTNFEEILEKVRTEDFTFLAKAYFETKNYKKALEFAEISFEQNPSFKSLALLSEIHLKNGTSNKALVILQKFVETATNKTLKEKAIFRIGEIQRKGTKDLSGAVLTYKSFLQEFPKSYFADDAQFNLGLCYKSVEDFTTASYEFKKLIENYSGSEFTKQAKEEIKFLQTKKSSLNGNDFSTLFDLLKDKPFEVGVFLYDKLGDYQNAVSYFEKAQKMFPSRKAEAIFWKAESNFAFANVSSDTSKARVLRAKAKSGFAEIVKSFPESAFVEKSTIKLVEIEVSELSEAEKTSKGILLYGSLLSRFPKSEFVPELLVKLGKLQVGVSDSEAISNFQRVVSEFPKSDFYKEALAFLGTTQAKNNNLSGSLNLENYRKAFPKGEEIIEVSFAYADLLLESGKLDEALSLYTDCAEKYFYSKSSAEANLKIGDIFFAKKFFGKAGESYKKFAEIEEAQDLRGKEDLLSFKLGRTAFEQSNFELAKNYYETYLSSANFQTQERKAIAGKELAKSYKALDETEKCLARIDEFKKEFSDKKGFLSELLEIEGMFLLEKDQNSKAYSSFDELLKVAQSDSVKMFSAAKKIVSLYRQDKATEAKMQTKEFEKNYKKTALKDYFAEFLIESGRFYVRQKDFSKAKKEVGKVIDDYRETSFSDNAEFLLGEIEIKVNEIVKGLEILGDLPQKYPQSEVLPEVYAVIGKAYAGKEQYDLAVANYKKSIELGKSNFANYRNVVDRLLDIYLALGLNDAALKLCNDYLKNYPEAVNSFDIEVQTGILYKRAGDYEKALEFLQGLLKDADIDQQAAIQFSIAECYEGLGKPEQAISEFLKVDFLGETKLQWGITSLYRAGLLYKQLGNKTQANTLFKKIIQRQGANDQFSKQAKAEIVE